MAKREHFRKITGGDQPRTGLRTPREHLQLRIARDITLVHPRKARMRLQANLIEAVRQKAVFILQILRKHAKNLLWQILFTHVIAIIERTHRAPAQIHSGEHMRGSPVKNLLELIPIIDLFEIKMLNRGTRHHEAVVIVVLERLNGLIELHQMVGAHMRTLVRGGLHEIDLHLQRTFRDQTQQLRFRLDFLRHEI